jgi:hypothetical protein
LFEDFSRNSAQFQLVKIWLKKFLLQVTFGLSNLGGVDKELKLKEVFTQPIDIWAHDASVLAEFETQALIRFISQISNRVGNLVSSQGNIQVHQKCLKNINQYNMDNFLSRWQKRVVEFNSKWL